MQTERLGGTPRRTASSVAPYLPALDGLRALAIVAVVAYHVGLPRARGGFLGVETFFVLSGYLVTLAVLRHRTPPQWPDEPGGLRMRRFWAGRVRRITPAYYLLIGTVAAAVLVGWSAEAPRLRSELTASLAFLSNWQQIVAHRSYFELTARPSPLRHLWSLAVEAQLYLAWPIVFGWLDRRATRRGTQPHGSRALVPPVLGLAFASVLTGLLLYRPGEDPTRVYYGTDTRAAGFLLGAALALAWRPWEGGRGHGTRGRRSALDAATAALLGGLLCLYAVTSELSPWTYRGGIWVTSALSAGLVAVAVCPDAGLARAVLGHPVARAVGRRSFGLYLWHWPVFALLADGRPADHGLLVVVALLALTVGLAELSYRYVELPVRRGRLREGLMLARRAIGTSVPLHGDQLVRTWCVLVALGVAAVGVLGIVLAGGPIPRPAFDPTARTVALGPGTATSAGDAAAPGDALSVTSRSLPPTTLPPPLPPGRADEQTSAPVTSAPAARSTASTVAAPVPTVLASAARVVAVGDSVLLSGADALRSYFPDLQIDASVGRQPGDGVDRVRAWRQSGGSADVLVVDLGDNGQFHGTQIEEIMALASGIRRVVFVNVHVPRPWEDQVNDTLAEVVPRFGNAVLVDWHARSASCGPDTFTPDDIHLTPSGAACYAALIAAAA